MTMKNSLGNGFLCGFFWMMLISLGCIGITAGEFITKHPVYLIMFIFFLLASIFAVVLKKLIKKTPKIALIIIDILLALFGAVVTGCFFGYGSKFGDAVGHFLGVMQWPLSHILPFANKMGQYTPGIAWLVMWVLIMLALSFRDKTKKEALVSAGGVLIGAILYIAMNGLVMMNLKYTSDDFLENARTLLGWIKMSYSVVGFSGLAIALNYGFLAVRDSIRLVKEKKK